MFAKITRWLGCKSSMALRLDERGHEKADHICVRYLKTCTFALACIFSFAEPSVAQTQSWTDLVKENQKNIGGEFFALKNAVGVVLVFEFPHVEHVEGLDEESLRKVGCTFSVNNKKKINDMIKIIEGSLIDSHEIDEESSFLHPQADAREGIFFKLQGGAEEKFLFEDSLASSPVLMGTLNRRDIVVRPSLVQKLYNWAAEIDYSGSNAVDDFASDKVHFFENVKAGDPCKSLARKISE